MKRHLPTLNPIPYPLNSKKAFTLIELLVACHPKLQRRKATLGFTLIELLVVIGVLTVLLAIVLIAINPARQFAQANDTQRRSDVNAILNAVHHYAADNKGQLPAEIPSGTPEVIGGATATQADICANLVPTYIAAIPVDPQDGSYTNCTTYDTDDYSIVENGGRITVSTPAQLGGTISITR